MELTKTPMTFKCWCHKCKYLKLSMINFEKSGETENFPFNCNGQFVLVIFQEPGLTKCKYKNWQLFLTALSGAWAAQGCCRKGDTYTFGVWVSDVSISFAEKSSHLCHTVNSVFDSLVSLFYSSREILLKGGLPVKKTEVYQQSWTFHIYEWIKSLKLLIPKIKSPLNFPTSSLQQSC